MSQKKKVFAIAIGIALIMIGILVGVRSTLIGGDKTENYMNVEMISQIILIIY